MKTSDNFFEEIEEVLDPNSTHHMCLLAVYVDGVQHIKVRQTDKDNVKQRDWQLKDERGRKLECSLFATFPNVIAQIENGKTPDHLARKCFRSLEK